MCESCLKNEKEYQYWLNKVQKEAKAHAVANQKMVVIYNEPSGYPAFTELDNATGANYFQYISYLQPDTDDGISNVAM